MTDNGSMMCDAKGSGDWGRCSESVAGTETEANLQHKHCTKALNTLLTIKLRFCTFVRARRHREDEGACVGSVGVN